MQYILDDENNPRKCPNLEGWGKWMSRMENRRIAIDKISGVTISTIFLGLDYDPTGKGPPVLFETMIFAPEGMNEQFNTDMERYSTYEKAIDGHNRAVHFVESTVI